MRQFGEYSFQPFETAGRFGPPDFGTDDDDADPRLEAAREAAIRSFHNRFGRVPTEDELAQSVPHFLPPALRYASSEGFGETATDAAPTSAPDADGGATDGDGTQTADAGRQIDDSPQIVVVQPAGVGDSGGIGRLQLDLRKALYQPWIRVSNADDSFWGWIGRSPTRPPGLGGAPNQVDVRLDVEISAGSSMRMQKDQYSVVNRLPPDQAVSVPLAAVQGPGTIYVEIANRGPAPVQVVLGATRR